MASAHPRPMRATVAALGLAGAIGSVSFVVAPSGVGAASETAAALRGGSVQAATPSQASAPLGNVGAAVCSAALLGAAAVASSSARRSCRPASSARKAEETPAPPPFDPSKQVGVTLPLLYFDPLGFSKVGDEAGFYNLRCAEIKHGRVAMIASLGLVAQHYVKFPGFDTVPAGFYAVITPPGTFGLVAVLAAAGGIETALWKQDPNKEPGNFGDPGGFGQYYPEWRDRELNNGRFGMIAFFAIVIAELVSGKDGVDQIWQPLSNLPVE